jgi:non-canonical purine NTP pyrophosphatase (RdgB/HAM1 family)
VIYFITGNVGKLSEAKSVINNIEGYDVDLPEIQEVDAHAIIRAKLLEGLKHKEGELVVEDTSLYYDTLNGLPGPLIKWFLKTIGTDGLYNLADKLGNTKAYAKSIIGYAKNADEIEFFEGVIEGEIVSPAGDKGFGWDSIFKPVGYDKTFGEMDFDEKNSLSMRKMAFEKLKEYLDE